MVRLSEKAYFSSFLVSFLSSFLAVFLPNSAWVKIAGRLPGQERGPAVKGVPARPSLQLWVRGSILEAVALPLLQVLGRDSGQTSRCFGGPEIANGPLPASAIAFRRRKLPDVENLPVRFWHSLRLLDWIGLVVHRAASQVQSSNNPTNICATALWPF